MAFRTSWGLSFLHFCLRNDTREAQAKETLKTSNWELYHCTLCLWWHLGRSQSMGWRLKRWMDTAVAEGNLHGIRTESRSQRCPLPFCEDCQQRPSYKELTLQRAVVVEGSCVGVTAFRISSVACICILWARTASSTGQRKGSLSGRDLRQNPAPKIQGSEWPMILYFYEKKQMPAWNV